MKNMRPLSFYTGLTPLVEKVSEKELQRSIVSLMLLSILDKTDSNKALLARLSKKNGTSDYWYRSIAEAHERLIAHGKSAWENTDVKGIEDTWINLQTLNSVISK